MINDPVVVRFTNEQVRPLCQSLRALKARIEAAQTAWFAGINNQVPNDSTALDDGREEEGVSRLTGADINAAMSVLIAVANATNDEIISKPCVGPLSAE